VASVARKKVVLIARSPTGGVWAVMRELARGLPDVGWSAEVLCFAPPEWPHWDETSREDIRVRVLGSPSLPGTAAFLWHHVASRRLLEQLVTRERAVFHFHNAWMTGAFLTARMVRERGVMVTFHGLPRERNFARGPIRRWVHRWWASRVRRIGPSLVAVDPQGPELAAKVFGFDPAKFEVVLNGVSEAPALGCPGARQRASLLTVLHAGGLGEAKGWGVALEAVRLAR